ncbi:MAG: acetate--CoA ligase family protein [Rhodobiaceae bacterium]|nr:acetate--CoA ligase family protein [Rhodobiaceae bacterium]
MTDDAANSLSADANREPRPGAAAIDALFNARSVAIIGASGEPTKLSSMPVLAMEKLGFAGKLTAVNPRYQNIGRWPCVESIDQLPEGVEAAIILLPAAAAVEAAQVLVERGVKALVIVAQGFGESGPEGQEREARLVALAREHDVAICGPNTNGLANIANGLGLSFAPALLSDDKVPAGRVSIISQSGAIISTILSKTNGRGVGIAKFVSCGNELTLGMADFLHYFAADPETDTILLYVEAVRDPAGLKAALRACRAAGKRVVAMKAGESDGGKKAALSHTGAIAGSYRAILAFLKSEGVVVADELDTLAALTECVMRHPVPLPQPAKPAFVSVSGGYAALAADCMARLGLALYDLSERAKAELKALPIQSHPLNPYDTAAQHAIITQVFDVFRRDGFNQMMVGLTPLAEPVREIMQPMLIEARKSQFAELYVFAPGMPIDEIRQLQAANIVVSESLWPQMQALKAMQEVSTTEPPPRSDRKPLSEISLPKDKRGLLNEAEGKKLLAALGIETPCGRVVTRSPAMADFAGLARPLALKGLSSRIAHKTEHELVALNLTTDKEIAAACSTITAALLQADPNSPGILAEEMAEGGLEAIIGMRRDPVAGPVMVIGAGGILSELLDDASIVLAPFDASEIRRQLADTRFGKLLNGYRGRTYDIDALIAAVCTVGQWSLNEPVVDEIDINPVLVRKAGDGIVALDAKVYLACD